MPDKKKPGRPREFDPTETAAAAVAVFREHGYGPTTSRRLEASLGVNQGSLYRVFESKLGLLNAALDEYEKVTEELLLGPLRDGRSGLADIDAYFDSLAANLGNGCLLVALMSDDSDDLKGVGERTRRYRAELREAMSDALGRAGRLGEIPASSIPSRVEILTSIIIGINVEARDAPDASEAQTAIAGARAELQRWHS